MKLEDWIEARLAGQPLQPPTAVDEENRYAILAHEAMMYAVEETIGYPSEEMRSPPNLPEDYQVVRELGQGGMGVVYLARQNTLGREVAVKVLSPGIAARPVLVRRFLEEARHMARMRHPNIVAVHEVGRAEGEPYFAMEYIPGESLAARLQRGPLTPAHAVALMKQIVEAVRHAHEQGIIHRDLKPGNILIDPDGRAHLTDFGLARHMVASADLTRSGELLGTPAYMAPEQVQGDSSRIGEATDIHALGAILYEMLTGKPPFGLDTPMAVFSRLLHEEPVPPRKRNPRIHRDLETICLKALAKTPAARYASARAFLEDLNRYDVGDSILARRPGLFTRAGRLLVRQWRLLTILGLTAGLLVLLSLYLMDRSVADLKSWAREREARGDLVGAIDVYQRAWRKAEGSERVEIRNDLLRCLRQVRDPDTIMTFARELLREAPTESLGEYDYLIIQKLLTEVKSSHGGVIRADSTDDRDLLGLIQKRLQMFLASPQGTEEQRQVAEQNLAAVTFALAGPGDVPVLHQDFPVHKIELPTGSNKELREVLTKESQHPWTRGLACYALALRPDNPERKADAARAFALLRSVYPMYSGVARATVISPTDGNRIAEEASECAVLREAQALHRKLTPDAADLQRGGVRFQIRGVDLPTSLAVSLFLHLEEKETPLSDQRFLPHRTIPFQAGESRVGVTDGTYRLKLKGPQISAPPAMSRQVRLLQLDLDRVPASVTIRGRYVDVVIPARRLTEVRLLGPAAGATFDPAIDLLRWESVKGAAYYRVKLTHYQDGKDSRVATSLPEVQVKTPRVCLGTLEDPRAADRLAELRPGRICTWSVEAYDRENRRIAINLNAERTFLTIRRPE